MEPHFLEGDYDMKTNHTTAKRYRDWENTGKPLDSDGYIMHHQRRRVNTYHNHNIPYQNTTHKDSLQNTRHFTRHRTLTVSNVPFSVKANELMEFLNMCQTCLNAVERVQLISHSTTRHSGKGKVLFTSRKITTAVLHCNEESFECNIRGRTLEWRRWKRRKQIDIDDEEEKKYDEEHDAIYNLGPASYIFSSKSYPYCMNQRHTESFHSVAFDFGKRCIRARCMFDICYVLDVSVTPKAIEYEISFKNIMDYISYYENQDKMIIDMYHPIKKYKIYPHAEYEDFDTEKSLCERAERSLSHSKYAQTMTIIIQFTSAMIIPQECLSLLKRYNLLKIASNPFKYKILSSSESKANRYSISNPPQWVFSLNEGVQYLLSTLHSKQPAKLSYESMSSDSKFISLMKKYNEECNFLLCTALDHMFWDSTDAHYIDEPSATLEYYISQKFSPRHSEIETGFGLIRHVLVSLSGIQTLPPYLETTNRVVRWYPGMEDRFIRVTFCEDNGARLHYQHSLNKETKIWLFSVLKNGITIGERTYEFLAFGSSQLNEQSVWMFCEWCRADGNHRINADVIRARMGDFDHIKSVAKYAARMGQCFSTTVDSIKTSDVEKIEDITHPFVHQQFIHDVFEFVDIPYALIPSKIPKNICFSDGVGRISTSFANKVAFSIGLLYTPSAFQIRYGGYKGMVTVHPECKHDLELRDSMYKFQSNDNMFEVCRYSFCSASYLNRQIITLFETINPNVSTTKTLVNISKKCIDGLTKMRMNREAAISQLKLRAFSNNPLCPLYILMQVLQHRIPMQHPFISSAIDVFVRSELKNIQNRHRILIEDGVSLLGVMDEYGVLKANQVFIQLQSPLINKNRVRIISGDVIITKCPALAPGDLRKFTATTTMNVYIKLKHLKNVIVFSQKGTLSPTMQMAGSDLDGDIYWITWNRQLLSCFGEEIYNEKAMYFPSPKAKIVSKVTIQDLQEFFMDYMQMDCLGMLAHSHLAVADQERNKAKNRRCLILTVLNSYAVDYRKSGTPVDIKKILQWYGVQNRASLLPKQFPYFMRKYNSGYHSYQALGQIYRNCKDRMESLYKESDLRNSAFNECKSFDKLWTVDGYNKYEKDAMDVLEHYEYDICAIKNRWQIRSEMEIFMNLPLHNVKLPNLRDWDIKQKIKHQMNAIKNKYRAIFFEEFDDDNTEKKENISKVVIRNRFNVEMKRKASAWYIVTMRNISRSPQRNVLTLPFVIFDVLCSIC